jgi:hypothetical protein
MFDHCFGIDRRQLAVPIDDLLLFVSGSHDHSIRHSWSRLTADASLATDVTWDGQGMFARTTSGGVLHGLHAADLDRRARGT